MLDHRQYPARKKAISLSPPEPCHKIWIGAESTVTDRLVGVGSCKIKARDTVHINTKLHQVCGDQAGVQPHGALCHGRFKAPQYTGGRSLSPVGCLKTLYASAFLIDQDRDIVPPERATKFPAQRHDLIGRTTVAMKEDEPQWISLGEKRQLIRRRHLTGNTENDGTRRRHELVT
jgi:hypothetical protein